ncbi:uncharacterized protein PADG_06102 [Paracoccidioides brasiliensis Pb18]|uniref:Uncharacterized protein n=1 Tax=Paracoccidioides brasiliensis (strain Pb18) TaxID=502780 RepID=C1GFR6_PARBD|nr:uncharacterized protein PADG_06102 [Paracoccidioides brasiliensis Pb18]EEH50023.2 hypothetical protein PADG_06102 [Paracoccidioides brasiliensis Pb18]
MLISHLKSDNPSLPEEGRNAAGSNVPFVPRWDESTSTAIITSPPLLFWMVASQRAPLLSHGIGMPRVRVGHLQSALSTSTMSSVKKGIRQRHPSEWNQLITDMMEPLLIKTAGDTANEEIFEPEKIVNPRLFSQTASALSRTPLSSLKNQ